jgi:hypothetical protein
MLPLLTVVFLLSYGLMSVLIVEQGAAIQSQSNLIKILMPESHELWSLKGKAIANDQAAKAKKPVQSQAPSVPTPSGNAQVNQPSARAGSQSHAQNRANKVAKPQMQFPPIPASDLDPRRTVRTI